MSTGACESSFRAVTTSAREERNAGAKPEARAAINDTTSEKARTRLGYRGVVTRDEALQLTKAWAQAARLI